VSWGIADVFESVYVSGRAPRALRNLQRPIDLPADATLYRQWPVPGAAAGETRIVRRPAPAPRAPGAASVSRG